MPRCINSESKEVVFLYKLDKLSILLEPNMLSEPDMFAVVTFLTVGLLGILGLLVVYIARGVNYLKQISEKQS